MASNIATNMERREADKYAEQGLNGDGLEHDDRMRMFAYAQVQATIYLGDQVGRIANALDGRMAH
jgi:hypothetical protein